MPAISSNSSSSSSSGVIVEAMSAAGAGKVTKWVGIELVRSGNGAAPKV
jgi:hypothetical protein